MSVTSSGGGNTTNEDLTAVATTTDAEGDVVRASYDWRVNGSSIATLNANFDIDNSAGSGKTKDYSSYGNNITVTGATFTAGVGLGESGAYSFSGNTTTELLNISYTVLNGSLNSTASFWIKTSRNPTNRALLSGANSSNNNAYLIIFTNATGLSLYTGVSATTVVNWTVANISDNIWHHIAVVRDATNDAAYLYIDGASDNENPKSSAMGQLIVPANGLFFGQEQDSVGGGFDPTQAYGGLVDDLIIFNRSLSSQEIAYIYQNQTDKMAYQEILSAENWSACATPNDGYSDGTTVCSTGLLVLEGSAMSAVSITPSPAYTNDILQGWCNGTGGATGVSYHYQWYRNTTLNLTGYATNGGLNYTNYLLSNVANLSAANTTKGENWTFSCLAYDGYANSTTWLNSTPVMINNAAPSVTSLIVNSTLGVNQTTENLTVYVSVQDNDSDSYKTIIDWRVNGTSIALLNMNFDVNNSNGTARTQDYATNGNSLNVTGARWEATTGRNNSGAYNFTGTTSYLNQSTFNGAPSGNVSKSISVWVKNPSCNAVTGEVVGGIGQTLTGNNFQIDMCYANTFSVLGWGATNDWNTTINSTPYANNAWHYLVVTYNGSNTTFYVDGVNVASTRLYSFNISTGAKIIIGEEIDGAGRGYTGLIDDFTIYNLSLSEQQIIALYNNRTDIVVAEETEIGENWTACVTPNDGIIDGVASCSSGLLIAGVTDSCTPPSINNNWVVYASDNCTKSATSINLGTGKLTVSGATGPGYLRFVGANITAANIEILGYGNLSRIVLESNSKIIRPTS